MDDIPNCSVADRIILELINDEDVHIEQLSEMIQENPSLAALIIGLANSAYFSSPTSIHTVRDAAIKVLGMRMVKSVVLSVVLGRSLDTSKCPNFSTIHYWTNCLTTARFCQMILQQSHFRKMVTSDEMYLCALLAGFGELVLIHHYPEEMNELISACEGDLELYVNSQSSLLGIHQGQAGVLMGSRWVLPPRVLVTMQHCFNEDYQGQDSHLSSIVGDVSKLVNRINRGETELNFSPKVQDILELTATNSKSLLEQLPELRCDLEAIAQHLMSKA